MHSSTMLTTTDLRVLRAVDEYPGGTTIEVLEKQTGYGELNLRVSLAVLYGAELINSATVERTGRTWYRTTRAGRDQLVRTPPPRRWHRARPGQLEIGAPS